MHIKVNHHDAFQFTLIQEHSGGDGHIIENAEATAEFGMGMVSPSGEVTGNAMAQSHTGSQESSSHREPGSLNQRSSRRQANPPLFRSRQLVTTESLVITAVVNPFEILSGDAEWAVDLLWLDHLLLQQQAAQQPEFLHRKTMG